MSEAAPARRPRRLLHLLIAPGVVGAVSFAWVAQRLDAGFFHGLSAAQLYALSAASVLLTALLIVLLWLALMRVRVMRVGGRRYAVPQECSAEQIRAWQAGSSA